MLDKLHHVYTTELNSDLPLGLLSNNSQIVQKLFAKLQIPHRGVDNYTYPLTRTCSPAVPTRILRRKPGSL